MGPAFVTRNQSLAWLFSISGLGSAIWGLLYIMTLGFAPKYRERLRSFEGLDPGDSVEGYVRYSEPASFVGYPYIYCEESWDHSQECLSTMLEGQTASMDCNIQRRCSQQSRRRGMRFERDRLVESPRSKQINVQEEWYRLSTVASVITATSAASLAIPSFAGPASFWMVNTCFCTAFGVSLEGLILVTYITIIAGGASDETLGLLAKGELALFGSGKSARPAALIMALPVVFTTYSSVFLLIGTVVMVTQGPLVCEVGTRHEFSSRREHAKVYTTKSSTRSKPIDPLGKQSRDTSSTEYSTKISRATVLLYAAFQSHQSRNGGGINVLSALIIIWELMRRIQAIRGLHEMPLPCDLFDLMCGTGTGGYVLASSRLRLPITTAIECYVEILNRGFVKKGLGIRFGTDEVFSATALERVMGEIVSKHCGTVDTRMIDEQNQIDGCKVMVCAMSADAIRGSIPTFIRTYRIAANQGPECTIVEAVRATMATPGMFKKATIIEQSVKIKYISGALGCSNPTTHMINEAEKLFPGRLLATVLSVGSGQLHSAKIPDRSKLLQFLPLQLVQTLDSIATDCERTNQELSRRFSHASNVYFRFNADQGMQNIDQSDLARLSEVRAHTLNYLKDAVVTSKMDSAAQSVTGGFGACNDCRTDLRGLMLSHLIEGNIQLPKQPNTRIGRCPPPSRVFTGRQDILDQMDSYFSTPASLERRLFVLHGLGGAGKTQLALKFVQSHKALFRDIFYIDATTRETISAGLAVLAKVYGTGETPEDGLAWLVSQEERWLLVLNNADDPDLNLHEFFPSCDHGDILITTRNQQVVNHATEPESYCRVGGMPPDDALELLLKSSGSDRIEQTVSAAKKLVDELCYFALAIVQSGAYMRARQCGVEEYARIFRTARTRLLRERPSKQMSDYDLSVFATWEISSRQLSSEATQLLHLISFLHHEGISAAFFERASTRALSFESDIPLTESQNATKRIVFEFLSMLRTPSDEWDPLALKDLTDQLRAFSLLDYDTHSCSYSMHPLVKEWYRSTAPDATDVRERATWLLALCVEEKFESEDYALRRRLLPHLLAVGGDPTQMVPELAKIMGLVYFEAGYAKESETLMGIAVQASRDTLGNEHSVTLTCMHNLATAFWRQGRLEEAEVLQTEVVEANKRVRGHADSETLTSMHVLALTYCDQERWQEAEALFLEVIEAQKQVNGAEHSHTLTSMGMLSSTYRRQGRLDEAELLQVEVLEATQRVLGREHPDTLVAMHNLAATYEQQGKLQKAEELMAETVALKKQVRGESHVETQVSVQYLETIQQRIQLELSSANVP
ncbi:hypothetical protein BDV93DRAFT_515829 [Ceratobasidium sp. AG-I]|nr:hypothetical protein BDV93DRAFT_515829 [Ceratobasidium sp. AG-I]